ncbi:transcription termination factor MTERF2, chloroplastic-like [Humulus lupulus]|uniref:transcription termination factor MTERF2, chloroplastic-like n=1 Tax=Humulus lupulus TaxID=3486 RepID=UPI002B4020D6|nr:transcription termination factor MTERF2, chloroplastic-like [Humulus lupulus]
MLTRVTSRSFFSSRFTLQHMASNPSRSFLCLFSSRSSPTTTTNLDSRLALVDCLRNTYKLTKVQALSISDCFPSVKSTDKPHSVHKLFLEYGLSDTHIRSAVLGCPQTLFADADKTLRGKLEALVQLGMKGDDLGKFLSKNPTVLARSLENKLKPGIELLKDILGDDANSKDFMRILKCRWILWADHQRLLANRTFLKSCGLVGTQLAFVLKMEPRICLMHESELRDLVSRVLDMGVPLASNMFPHALHAIGGLRKETVTEKLELLGSLGFSEGESLEMFRRAPLVLRTSEEKLRFGVDFYLNTAKFKRSVLIRSPWLLMSSMEKRVIPRYKVLQVLKLKRLLVKEPSFYTMLQKTEGQFLLNFISKFQNYADELLVVYKGHKSGSIGSLKEEES